MLFFRSVQAAGDEMARAKQAINQSSVRTHVQRLNEAGFEKAARDAAMEKLTADTALSAADIIEIADQFAVPGKRPSSKKAALELISKRFVELARQHKQVAIASKVRI